MLREVKSITTQFLTAYSPHHASSDAQVSNEVSQRLGDQGNLGQPRATSGNLARFSWTFQFATARWALYHNCRRWSHAAWMVRSTFVTFIPTSMELRLGLEHLMPVFASVSEA